MPVCPALPSSIPWSRAYAREQLGKADLPEAVRTDVILAVSEAVTNAVRHSGSDTVEVELNVGPSAIEVVVRDHGIYEYSPPEPALDDTFPGHGVPIMVTVMDHVEVRPGTADDPGTTVRMRRRIGRDPMERT